MGTITTTTTTLTTRTSTTVQEQVVQGALTLTVAPADLATFQSDPKVKTALQNTIAGQLPGVFAADVTILRVTALRRLAATEPRRLSGNVHVDFAITLPPTFDPHAASAQLKDVPADSFTAALTDDLESAGVSVVVQVESAEASVAAPDASSFVGNLTGPTNETQHNQTWFVRGSRTSSGAQEASGSLAIVVPTGVWFWFSCTAALLC